MKIYSIFDRKVKVFMCLFFVLMDGQVFCEFYDMCNEFGYFLFKYLEDYCFECVGEWDDQYGVVMLVMYLVVIGLDCYGKEMLEGK